MAAYILKDGQVFLKANRGKEGNAQGIGCELYFSPFVMGQLPLKYVKGFRHFVLLVDLLQVLNIGNADFYLGLIYRHQKSEI